MEIASFVVDALGGTAPFYIEAFDGSTAGSPDLPLRVRIVRNEGLVRVLTRPGELGLARAYVAGDIDLDGDLDALFDLQAPSLRQMVRPAMISEVFKELGGDLLSPPAPPEVEATPKGRLHGRSRDRQAISHHYDVSNRFYELILGPSMTYSCAVFESPDDTLEQAQENKVDLIARKLGLEPGMRLLDVGCGWGTMAIHAAKHYGASVVGVTLAAEQQAYATQRAIAEGVADRVEFRLQDFRDVADGLFDAISSIGMFEHVGRRSMEQYFATLWGLLRPGGRLLNHAIGRPATRDEDPVVSRPKEVVRHLQVAAGLRGPSRVKSAFIDRYVFPDGELHEVGTVISMLQAHGFELRHLETLREHYALTLRQWVANLDANREAAVAEVGEQRARVWKLYMAGSAVGFENNHLQVHQALCVRPAAGRSFMPLRARFDHLEA